MAGYTILAKIASILADVGLDKLKEQLDEDYGSKELNPQQTKDDLVKFVEESDMRQKYGLVKGYCESIEDLFEKLRREEWYVVMADFSSTIKGTKAHENWRYLTGQCLINHDWHHELYDGHPEGKMFLRVHLHVLLDVVGFEIEYREELIERHWGELLPIAKRYEYGKIWNMYFGYGKPQRWQWFEGHAGTLYGAAWWKWLKVVSNMYVDVVNFLHQQGKIECPILHRKDDYYVVTWFASGVGKQDIY